LSAWYIFSSLGFYPVPCTEDYLIGSPVFPRAVVQVPGGELVIVAENTSARNIYVQSVEWNGQRLTEPFLRHSAIAGGGTLRFVMGPEPSTWGVSDN